MKKKTSFYLAGKLFYFCLLTTLRTIYYLALALVFVIFFIFQFCFLIQNFNTNKNKNNNTSFRWPETRLVFFILSFYKLKLDFHSALCFSRSKHEGENSLQNEKKRTHLLFFPYLRAFHLMTRKRYIAKELKMHGKKREERRPAAYSEF